LPAPAGSVPLFKGAAAGKRGKSALVAAQAIQILEG